MILKSSVKPRSLQPQISLALTIADKIYQDVGVELVVTSLNDGNHSYNSLHWSGNAADLRTRTLPEDQRQPIRDRLSQALGSDYDVILESDHIHVEYQPKGSS